MIDILNTVIQAIIASAALFALSQIRLSKRSFELNSKRESIRYASELTNDFLNKIIPLSKNWLQNTTLPQDPKYKNNFNLDNFTIDEVRNCPELQGNLISILNLRKNQKPDLPSMNAIESFSTPFISGVADEEIAFTSVGPAFCFKFENNYIDYCLVRSDEKKGFNYFENTIKLYKIWSVRIKKHELKNKEETIQIALKDLIDNPITVVGSKI